MFPRAKSRRLLSKGSDTATCSEALRLKLSTRGQVGLLTAQHIDSDRNFSRNPEHLGTIARSSLEKSTVTPEGSSPSDGFRTLLRRTYVLSAWLAVLRSSAMLQDDLMSADDQAPSHAYRERC